MPNGASELKSRLPARLHTLLDAEFPRFSLPEMERRRQAIATAMRDARDPASPAACRSDTLCSATTFITPYRRASLKFC